MTLHFKVARLMSVTAQVSKLEMPYRSVRFRLLEPITLGGKKVRTVFANFSEQLETLGRLKQLYNALQITTTDMPVVFPDNRLKGRYCKLDIQTQTYLDGDEPKDFLNIRAFMPINDINTFMLSNAVVIPPEEQINVGLAKLHIPARIIDGKLVIESVLEHPEVEDL